jgi:putative MATE family efflux protein
MFIVLITVLLNLALDPLFIFGLGPVPAMGVAGAAMATVCTQALATLIGFTLLLGGKHDIRIRWRNFKIDMPLVARAFRLGLPTSVEQSSRAMGMTMMTILASGFGTIAVAAYGTGTRVLACVIIPALGLSMAVSTLVAQNIGANRIDRAERTCHIGGLLAFTVLLLPGLVLFTFARPFVTFFIPEAGSDTINQCATFIRTMAFTFGFIGVQQVIAGTLRGAGNTAAAMMLAITTQWVFQFPLAWLLSHKTALGATGIWWAVAIANVLSTFVAVVWFLRGDWKQRRLLDEIQLQQRVDAEIAVDEGLPPA